MPKNEGVERIYFLFFQKIFQLCRNTAFVIIDGSLWNTDFGGPFTF